MYPSVSPSLKDVVFRTENGMMHCNLNFKLMFFCVVFILLSYDRWLHGLTGQVLKTDFFCPHVANMTFFFVSPYRVHEFHLELPSCQASLSWKIVMNLTAR